MPATRATNNDGQRMESNTTGLADNNQQVSNQEETRNNPRGYAHGGHKRLSTEEDGNTDKGKQAVGKLWDGV